MQFQYIHALSVGLDTEGGNTRQLLPTMGLDVCIAFHCSHPIAHDMIYRMGAMEGYTCRPMLLPAKLTSCCFSIFFLVSTIYDPAKFLFHSTIDWTYTDIHTCLLCYNNSPSGPYMYVQGVTFYYSLVFIKSSSSSSSSYIVYAMK